VVGTEFDDLGQFTSGLDPFGGDGQIY